MGQCLISDCPAYTPTLPLPANSTCHSFEKSEVAWLVGQEAVAEVAAGEPLLQPCRQWGE